MHRTPVTSTNLSSVGYDHATGILEIAFHSGGLYQYAGVPANVYQSLMSASSHGQYFHRFIKDIYPYRKLR